MGSSDGAIESPRNTSRAVWSSAGSLVPPPSSNAGFYLPYTSHSVELQACLLSGSDPVPSEHAPVKDGSVSEDVTRAVSSAGINNNSSVAVSADPRVDAFNSTGRAFCSVCHKAKSVCICDRFSGKVDNQTGVTILQHPKEKYHPLGTARIALLGLQNVQVIVVPLGHGKSRLAPKIPGSKRSQAGRAGNRRRSGVKEAQKEAKRAQQVVRKGGRLRDNEEQAGSSGTIQKGGARAAGAVEGQKVVTGEEEGLFHSEENGRGCLAHNPLGFGARVHGEQEGEVEVEVEVDEEEEEEEEESWEEEAEVEAEAQQRSAWAQREQGEKNQGGGTNFHHGSKHAPWKEDGEVEHGSGVRNPPVDDGVSHPFAGMDLWAEGGDRSDCSVPEACTSSALFGSSAVLGSESASGFGGGAHGRNEDQEGQLGRAAEASGGAVGKENGDGEASVQGTSNGYRWRVLSEASPGMGPDVSWGTSRPNSGWDLPAAAASAGPSNGATNPVPPPPAAAAACLLSSQHSCQSTLHVCLHQPGAAGASFSTATTAVHSVPKDQIPIPSWVGIPMEGTVLLYPSRFARMLRPRKQAAPPAAATPDAYCTPVPADSMPAFQASTAAGGQQGRVEQQQQQQKQMEMQKQVAEDPSGAAPIRHLIVLDGTWPKAKRLYMQHPWLHSLPHVQLPTLEGSLYGFIRKQPKEGCVSTIEAIVYALQCLEPQAQGLESLLSVFDSMVEDQVQCMCTNRKIVRTR